MPIAFEIAEEIKAKQEAIEAARIGRLYREDLKAIGRGMQARGLAEALAITLAEASQPGKRCAK